MCGIIGIFNTQEDPVSSDVLSQMTDILYHRGPDNGGIHVDNFIGLGHRRLSIIDLSENAHQPMVTEDKQVVLTYNGEVYNYKELMQELIKKGHTFFSQSDAEVVLRSYLEWGEDCVTHFNGMFAFGIWDKPKNKLFLARDRYGIKPLYYTQCGSTFMFASEIKSFTKHPKFKPEVDKEGLIEYFTFQNFFTNKTLHKNTYLLPAGNTMSLSLDHPKPVLNQYWDFDFQEPEKQLKREEYLEELDRLFNQAVNRQLVSDVEIGSYLSGGMDSGSITAVAAAELPYIKSFTCGFDLNSASGLELSFDEREKAEYMSYVFKTEHYEMVLKAGDMERCLPKLAWHLEEPRVGQSYPNFYAAQLASKFVKVVFSGGGGDELFGGYPWRYYRAVINHNFEDYIDKYYVFWQRLIRNNLLHEVFKPIKEEIQHVWTRDIFRDVFKQHQQTLTRPEDYINHSLYFEAKTFLNGLLIVEDKLSMAHSLETRLPFLDNDLVDFAMKLPAHLKLQNLKEIIRLNENDPGPKTKRYFEKTSDGKLLLREMMNRYIPEKITKATKQGFSAPDASWFKGESIDFVKSVVNNNNSKIYEFMDQTTVQNLVDEHLEGKQNRRLFIWSLLNFEWWLAHYYGS